MKIYTKRGDSGKTDLFGISNRISKSSIRVSAYGEIDELNSFIGLIRSNINETAFKKNYKDIEKALEKIKNDFTAKPDPNKDRASREQNYLS